MSPSPEVTVTCPFELFIAIPAIVGDMLNVLVPVPRAPV